MTERPGVISVVELSSRQSFFLKWRLEWVLRQRTLAARSSVEWTLDLVVLMCDDVSGRAGQYFVILLLLAGRLSAISDQIVEVATRQRGALM